MRYESTVNSAGGDDVQQAFQMFHDTTAESSDLYNYKQKDRETLRNFVRRFMQRRS
jgi:hypothetical protein